MSGWEDSVIIIIKLAEISGSGVLLPNGTDAIDICAMLIQEITFNFFILFSFLSSSKSKKESVM